MYRAAYISAANHFIKTQMAGMTVCRIIIIKIRH
jgi:hypothetical protein